MVSLRELNIGRRLGLGFGLLLALIAVVATMALFQMGRLADGASYYAENLVPSYEMEHATAMRFSDIRRWGYIHIVTNSPEEMADMESKIATTLSKVNADFDRYDTDLASDETDRNNTKAAKLAVAQYMNEWAKVQPVSRLSNTNPAKTEEAKRLMGGEAAKAYMAAQAAINKWWDYNVKMAQDQEVAASATYKSAKWWMGTLVTLAMVFGVGAAVVITRSISVPLAQAVGVTTQAAEGNLTAAVDTTGSDEVTQLLVSLRKMQGSLSGVVRQVITNSESVATASAQIAQGNGDLSQRTEQQASGLQETAATMEQLGSTVRKNADSAQQANQLAQSAATVADQGGEVVGKVVTTMQGISQSSKKIGDIIGVIDGIAFQTNILALNAAVEAARAGEQGRGFAVVASEVRTLAQRSAAAAGEIRDLISTNVNTITGGAEVVTQAQTIMSDVVQQAQQVSTLVQEIGLATQEQTKGLSHANDAIGQLDNSTQQNAALVEQSAAAASSLREQSQRLVDVVGRFAV